MQQNILHSITSSAVRRHDNAEHARGRSIDDQLELGRLHYARACGLGAFENAPNIDARLGDARRLRGRRKGQ